MTRTELTGRNAVATTTTREALRHELDAQIAERVRRRVQEIDEAWPWSTETLR